MRGDFLYGFVGGDYWVDFEVDQVSKRARITARAGGAAREVAR